MSTPKQARAIFNLIIEEINKDGLRPLTKKEMSNIISNLLSGVLQRKAKNVTSRITNEKLEYALFFRKGFLDSIMVNKGCKSYDELGKLVGYTRQHIHRLAKQKSKVSDDTIVRFAALTGSLNDRWWVAFEILPVGIMKPTNHQSYNSAKFKGEIPYEKYSVSAAFRALDEENEVEKNS